MKKIRWGILGVNWIARNIAGALALSPNAELTAVAARTRSNVEAFAADFGIPLLFSSCEELAAAPVDIVYISTPHGLHYEHAKLCLEKGKSVLCEKAFTVNERQADELFRMARERGLFIMEAMWTRFLPSVHKLKELTDSGAIGTVRFVKTENCFVCRSDPAARCLNPALAGGALLDVGIYALTIPDIIIGRVPQHVVSAAVLGSTGVDLRNSAVLTYSGAPGEETPMASIMTAFDMKTDNYNYIYGSKGRITFNNCSSPRSITLYDYETGAETPYPFEYRAKGYEYMIGSVMDDLSAGRTENATVPGEVTLAMMRLMDRIRGQWGLKYPME